MNLNLLRIQAQRIAVYNYYVSKKLYPVFPKLSHVLLNFSYEISAYALDFWYGEKILSVFLPHPK